MPSASTGSLFADRPARPWVVRLSTWAIPALAVVVVLLTAASHDHLLGDDAYITFRYARNLATGRGLVYNPGETVLGTSTPLFTLLLAAGHRLGLPLPDLAIGISAWAWAGVVMALAWAHRGRPWWAAAPLLVLAASATFAENLGMESALYALLCLLSLRLVSSGRSAPAAALAGLAAITRLDGGLLAAMVLVIVTLQRRRLPFREATIVMLIVAPWYAYAWLHFGSPFPNSLHAKAGLAHSAGFGGGDFVQGGLALLRSRLQDWPALAAHLALAFVGLLALLRRWCTPWAAYLAWGALYTVAYWLTGMPHFGWYYVPLAPLMAVLAIEGIQSLSAAGGRLPRLVVAALVLVLSLGAGQMFLHSLRSADVSAARAVAYREAGEWLAAEAEPDDSVALLEIGVVGYFSDLRVVDTMGLVSPYLAERLVDWGQSLVLALHHYWPEYVLALDSTAWEAVEREPWFILAYTPLAEFDHSEQGDPAARMRVYRRSAGYPPSSHHQWPVGASLGLGVRLEWAGLRGLPAVTPGATVPLTLTWRCLELTGEDLQVEAGMRTGDGQEFTIAAARAPRRGGLPTHLWRPGETIREVVPLSLPLNLPAGPAQLTVSLGGASVVLGEVIVSPTEEELIAILDRPEAIEFGGGTVWALGWTVHQSSAAPGGALDVTVGWRAPTASTSHLSLFLHLADAEGRPLAQWDGAPFAVDDPQQSAGAALAETYTVSIPTGVPPGEYHLLLGVYEWTSGTRLSPSSPHALPSDAVQLGEITVGERADGDSAQRTPR